MVAVAPDKTGPPEAFGKEPWLETYLKVLLLYIDRVSFVKAFLLPNFKTTSDLPTLCGSMAFVTLYICFAWVYMAFQVITLSSSSDDDSSRRLQEIEADGVEVAFMYLLPIFFLVVQPILWVVMLSNYMIISTKGRFGALMKMAQMEPPMRDHSKPYGFTYYKRAARHVVYTYVVIVGAITLIITGMPGLAIQMSIMMIIAIEPMNSAIERVWSSAAISNCEVIIAGSMQGQIVFGGGESNEISVNMKALAKLKWKDTSVRDKLLKAATSSSSYEFNVFDFSAGSYLAISKAGHKKVHEDGTSATEAVWQECRGFMKGEGWSFMKDQIGEIGN